METTGYLVEVNGTYFICEDKPEIKVEGVWQTDGMHVEVPHYVAVVCSKVMNVELTKNVIIDIFDFNKLF